MDLVSRRGLLLFCLPLCLLAAACDGAPTSPSPADMAHEGPPHLSAAATQQLVDIGINKYVGQAKILSEEQIGPVTRVTFDPASGPVCLFGAQYVAFLQKTGNSDKLLLFLGGGGACWTGFCAATPYPDDSIIPLGPLHVEVETNPFYGWNVLYLPYCDGSVFSGDNDVPDPPNPVRLFHGRRNLAAGMDLLDRLGPIHTVAVAGVSAGAYGSLAATAMTRLRYPTADLLVYDDSGPWIQNLARTDDVEARIKDWKFDEILPPGCTACDGGRGQLIEMMRWFMDNDDQIRVGMLSYYQDSVIGDEFTKLIGDDYKALLLEQTGKLHDAHPDRARRFMLAGTAHVLTLEWPNFINVGGVSIRDWTAGLVDAKQPWGDLLEP